MDVQLNVTPLFHVLFIYKKRTSTIHNVEQIDRGYERIDGRLRAIGA